MISIFKLIKIYRTKNYLKKNNKLTFYLLYGKILKNMKYFILLNFFIKM